MWPARRAVRSGAAVAPLPGAAGNFVLGLALLGAGHEVVVRFAGHQRTGEGQACRGVVARDDMLTAMVWRGQRLALQSIRPDGVTLEGAAPCDRPDRSPLSMDR